MHHSHVAQACDPCMKEAAGVEHMRVPRCAQAFEWVEEEYFYHLNFFWKLITPGLRRQKVVDVLLAAVRFP